jgi:hypothetical protein
VTTVNPKAKNTPTKPIPTSGKAAVTTALPQPARVSQKVHRRPDHRRDRRGGAAPGHSLGDKLTVTHPIPSVIHRASFARGLVPTSSCAQPCHQRRILKRVLGRCPLQTGSERDEQIVRSGAVTMAGLLLQNPSRSSPSPPALIEKPNSLGGRRRRSDVSFPTGQRPVACRLG